MQADKYFTVEEKARIQDCVRRAENGTSGEIAPMVAERSADYTGSRFTAAMAVALLAAAPWLLIRPFPHPLWIILAESLGFGITFLLFWIRPELLRFLVPESMMDRAVLNRAKLAFFEHGLHQTRDRTGVLILISLLERRVQILADEGINQKVPPSTWEELVHHLIEGIRRGEGAAALCQTIEHCGEILAQHFPKKPDDRDELTNQVITG